VQYRLAENYALAAEFSHMLSKAKNTAASINTNFKGLESNSLTLSAKYYFY
jgi:hypothetical protein